MARRSGAVQVPRRAGRDLAASAGASEGGGARPLAVLCGDASPSQQCVSQYSLTQLLLLAGFCVVSCSVLYRFCDVVGLMVCGLSLRDSLLAP